MTLGRPASLYATQRAQVQSEMAAGVSVSELARRYKTSRQTIMRVRNAAQHDLENRLTPQRHAA